MTSVLERDVSEPPRLHAPSILDRVYILIRARGIADEVREYLAWAFQTDSSDYIRGWHELGGGGDGECRAPPSNDSR